MKEKEMLDLAAIHHVKIPVSDLRASTEWYLRVLGLKVAIEFNEDGELRGVALEASDGTTSIALRHDPERAAALSGFDPVALGVPTRDGVRAWADHFDHIGQPHGGIVTGHHGGAVLVGLHDPDGIEIRLYAD
jgi:catechol 2,3-dioxygenase-like lactoylglutathione lyase family enzyme